MKIHDDCKHYWCTKYAEINLGHIYSHLPKRYFSLLPTIEAYVSSPKYENSNKKSNNSIINCGNFFLIKTDMDRYTLEAAWQSVWALRPHQVHPKLANHLFEWWFLPRRHAGILIFPTPHSSNPSYICSMYQIMLIFTYKIITIIARGYNSVHYEYFGLKSSCDRFENPDTHECLCVSPLFPNCLYLK